MLSFEAEKRFFDNGALPRSFTRDERSVQMGKEVKEIYECECGKQYLSFPATYLHFRAKHNIKLSTKPTQRRRVEVMDEQTRRIIYFLEEQDQGNEENLSKFPDQLQGQAKTQACFDRIESKGIKNCISQYLKKYKCSESFLYPQLIEFLIQDKQGDGNEELETTIDDMLFRLNTFVLDFLPISKLHLQVGSEAWKSCCEELNIFSSWLYNNGYTNLIVLYELL